MSKLQIPLGFILPPPSEMLAASGRFTSGGQDPNDYANLIVVVLGILPMGAPTDPQVIIRLRDY